MDPFNKTYNPDPIILNLGLNLAMAWGDDWLCDIQNRLSKLHPKLTKKELDFYNDTCKKAMNDGHKLVLACLADHGRDFDPVIFKTKYKEKYPWVSDSNNGHVYSQGMYYSMK